MEIPFTPKPNIMEQITICRTGYCPHCEKEERLKTGTAFLVHGATNGWKVLTAQKNSRYFGYVPHIYKLHKSLGENVIVFKSCAVEGCGSEWQVKNNQYWLVIPKENYQRILMTRNQWEAIILNPFKNDYDYFV